MSRKLLGTIWFNFGFSPISRALQIKLKLESLLSFEDVLHHDEKEGLPFQSLTG